MLFQNPSRSEYSYVFIAFVVKQLQFPDVFMLIETGIFPGRPVLNPTLFAIVFEKSYVFKKNIVF